ncbi:MULTISPECIES: hypothetical protein [Burkholderiaceae]|jgi:hypothetical protein|uniref:Uncharacterized protein n=2 Tax=Burkholderiaceae TaxID=119060 RepID=A0A6J5JHP6_9BURK|nr:MULTISPECIES: hypothetical protein [Burkholderiaceae]ANJ73142.1 hypothetical protein A9Y76_11940 [Ralstonia insidiosa]KAB0601788.1 hypothetical protein F7R19_14915 [Cupriavidus pauculus]MBR8495147.1 hypothetical protein [Burkholderia cenocepacia]MCO8393855.1 hypothetical protein [Burkholderia cenocepacia]MCO8402211.1 hypothetical protein [Burkholderia cenocepacia]
MSIYHLLDWHEGYAISTAIQEVEQAVAQNKAVEVYIDDHDYFYEAYVSLNHRDVCSFGYEYLDGVARLFSNIDSHWTYHYSTDQAVRRILDHLEERKIINNKGETA